MTNLKQRKITVIPTAIVSSEKIPIMTIPKMSYSIAVDYNLTVEQAIEKGHYGYVNPGISSESFKKDSNLKKVESIKIKLVHFNMPVSCYEVNKKLAEENLEPIGIIELLAFGAAYPENEDSEHLILAMGSNLLGMIPGLGSRKKETETKKEHTLGLYSSGDMDYDTEWSPDDVLFAVKEIESSLKK